MDKKTKYEKPTITKLDEKETAFGGFAQNSCNPSGSNAAGACNSGGIAIDGCEGPGNSVADPV